MYVNIITNIWKDKKTGEERCEFTFIERKTGREVTEAELVDLGCYITGIKLAAKIEEGQLGGNIKLDGELGNFSAKYTIHSMEIIYGPKE